MVSSIATPVIAFPAYKASIEETRAAGNLWLSSTSEKRELFNRFLSSSRTETRYFITPPSEVIQQKGLQVKTSLYEEYGVPLLLEATESLLQQEGISPQEVHSLIFTSCSVPVIPSIDTYLIERLNFNNTITRIPSYQFGCAGGVIALGVGHRLSSQLGTTIVLSLELNSLVFHQTDTSSTSIIGAALFGDGCAATLIKNGSGKLSYVDHLSYLIPNSRHLMGYDNLDDGFHLRLDKTLPSALVEVLPSLIHEFLGKHKLSPSAIRPWLVHPGGAKILDFIEDKFSLPSSALQFSEKALRLHGNLSSATIFSVVKEFINSNEYEPGEPCLVIGIGPGLTVELLLYRVPD